MSITVETTPIPRLALLLAWPSLCLSLILTGIILHVEERNLAWAWPWPIGSGTLILAATAAGLPAVVLAGWVGIQAGIRKQCAPWLEWLALHVLVFTGIWLLAPSAVASAWVWNLAALVLAATLFLAMHSQRTSTAPYGFTRRHALSDALIILAPLLAGYWAVESWPLQADGWTILTTLALYPAYALLQLGIFLLIPATRMQRLGYSPQAIILGTAVVFSMVHWPNPFLMLATGLAMLVWARQFLRGRSILALALVMGMTASGVRLMLPHSWTAEMRIGPGYIDKQAGASTNSWPVPVQWP